jgi:S1-C subfamily serine protease
MQTAPWFLKTSREHWLCDTYRSSDIEATHPADTATQVAANKHQQRFSHLTERGSPALRFIMANFQATISRYTHLVGSLLICVGVLTGSSSVQAQSSKRTTSVQAKRSALDNSLDPLHEVSTSLQLLSKRVSPGVVQIFSEGYKPDSDREHRNTDVLSRGVTAGSGIIVAPDGWIVTNAHVVQGGRRIRVQLNHQAAAAIQKGTRHALFDAKLVVADRDTDLALLKIDETDLPTLELSDSSI